MKIKEGEGDMLSGHLAAGVVIEKTTLKVLPKRFRFLRWLIIPILGVASHGLMDALPFVYHLKNPSDPAWWIYLLVHIGLIIFILRRWGVSIQWKKESWFRGSIRLQKYWFGIACAILPDLEVILYGLLKSLSIAPSWWHQGVFHSFLYDQAFPFFSNYLPNWRGELIGVIPELMLVAILLVLLIKLPFFRDQRSSF